MRKSLWILPLAVLLIPCGLWAAEETTISPIDSTCPVVDVLDPAFEPVETAGKSCGPTTCDKGERCCNAECGICAPAGGPCPLIGCPLQADDTELLWTAGRPCGPTTCAAGQVCCNESCGICTPPGGVCTQQECPPQS